MVEGNCGDFGGGSVDSFAVLVCFLVKSVDKSEGGFSDSFNFRFNVDEGIRCDLAAVLKTGCSSGE